MLTYDNLAVLSIGVFLFPSPQEIRKSNDSTSKSGNLLCCVYSRAESRDMQRRRTVVQRHALLKSHTSGRQHGISRDAAVFTLRELVSAAVLRLCAKPVREHLAKCCRMVKRLKTGCKSPRI